MKLEGIISKRRDAPYEAARSRSWLKVKCAARAGVRHRRLHRSRGLARGHRRAAARACTSGDRLDFAGKVGTGFTDKARATLRRRLDALEQKAEPVRGEARRASARAHWVKPELVAEVEFTEWTSDGRLRHPSFQGLREDKPARQVVREKPTTTSKRWRRRQPSVERRSQARGRNAAASPKEAERWQGVRLTNPDRVLYPDLGLTKLDLAAVLRRSRTGPAPRPGRPLTLVRCPEGIAEAVLLPEARRTGGRRRRCGGCKIQEKTKVGEYLVVDDLPGLIGLVQIGILEIHTWNSTGRRRRAARPDRLRPRSRHRAALGPRGGGGGEGARPAAPADGLKSFVKTTGGKGLHVVVPLGRPADLGRDLRLLGSDRLGDRRARSRRPSWPRCRRPGGRARSSSTGCGTCAAPPRSPRTPRARSRPPRCRCRLRWDELDPSGGPPAFNVKNVPARLASLKADPWAGVPEDPAEAAPSLRFVERSTELRPRSQTGSCAISVKWYATIATYRPAPARMASPAAGTWRCAQSSSTPSCTQESFSSMNDMGESS